MKQMFETTLSNKPLDRLTVLTLYSATVTWFHTYLQLK